MNCPRCADPLWKATLAVEKFVYCCKQEHGLALGYAVLQDGLEPTLITRLWAQARVNSQATYCPGCRHPMRVTELAVKDARVVFDLCKLCHLVWLDPGELRAVQEIKAKYPDVLSSAKAQRVVSSRDLGSIGTPVIIDAYSKPAPGSVEDYRGVDLAETVFEVIEVVCEVLSED